MTEFRGHNDNIECGLLQLLKRSMWSFWHYRTDHKTQYPGWGTKMQCWFFYGIYSIGFYYLSSRWPCSTIKYVANAINRCRASTRHITLWYRQYSWRPIRAGGGQRWDCWYTEAYCMLLDSRTHTQYQSERENLYAYQVSYYLHCGKQIEYVNRLKENC